MTKLRAYKLLEAGRLIYCESCDLILEDVDFSDHLQRGHELSERIAEAVAGATAPMTAFYCQKCGGELGKEGNQLNEYLDGRGYPQAHHHCEKAI